MRKVKIRVLKTTCNKELAKKYGHDDTYSECPVLNEGEVYYTSGIFGNDIPQGFCHMAWQALFMPVNALIGGGKVLGIDDVHVACCTDGLRPVIFELSAVEE